MQYNIFNILKMSVVTEEMLFIDMSTTRYEPIQPAEHTNPTEHTQGYAYAAWHLI